MARFKAYNYDQVTLLPVDFRRQILPGSFEWAVDHIVDQRLDLSVFDQRFRNDDGGAPAYDPAILLKIVLLAYARGLLSSSKIAAACQENIVFMALAADSKPHFTTIAKFVSSMAEVIEPLFTDVLMYCDQLDLIQGEMFAVDGCKLPSNAGKQHSGTREELRQRRGKLAARAHRLLDVHARNDAGPPEDDDSGDKARRENLDREIRRLDAFLASGEDRRGPSGRVVKSNITDNESAKMATSHGVIQGYNGLAAVDAGSQIVVHAQAIGQGPENDRLLPMLEGVQEQLTGIGKTAALTGMRVTADSGFHSSQTLEALAEAGVDAYVADTGMRSRDERFSDRDKHKDRHRKERKRQSRQAGAALPAVFGPEDFVYDAEAGTCHCPAGHALYSNGRGVLQGGHPTHRFRGSKTMCRPCPLRSQCLRDPAKTQTKQIGIRLETRPSAKHPAIEQMRAKIDSQDGRKIYSRRLGAVEPVFGNHRNHGRDRFTLRRRRKVEAQWRLYNLVHNIGKLHSSGRMAA
jgi:transposase